ncbi:hypothetical protein [Actinoplanes sp. NBRC 103695]|uniref:hypothetical protein n=1 Tax=Actinoplanes sp. NBRC 103695 TaxID=3032202 RepID=UPI0024A3CFF2|nr:hypothetical protein [Actinoplanes sp. NBRC 103695]GLZ00017.1 hypothetical protein Acsp02_72690 [Actinoplanes sp. NBRC 103695]
MTGARLTSVQLATTRGAATAPAWEFTLAGSAVRLTRIAVAPSAIVSVAPPSWDPDSAPGGLAIDSASGTVTGRQLSVSFTGSPGTRNESCGADYTAEAVESAAAIVVIVHEHRHPGDETCPAIGALRNASAELAEPLGERAVLEIQQGLPVPLSLNEMSEQ